jgi:hypothetical protein
VRKRSATVNVLDAFAEATDRKKGTEKGILFAHFHAGRFSHQEEVDSAHHQQTAT